MIVRVIKVLVAIFASEEGASGGCVREAFTKYLTPVAKSLSEESDNRLKKNDVDGLVCCADVI